MKWKGRGGPSGVCFDLSCCLEALGWGVLLGQLPCQGAPKRDHDRAPNAGGVTSGEHGIRYLLFHWHENTCSSYFLPGENYPGALRFKTTVLFVPMML